MTEAAQGEKISLSPTFEYAARECTLKIRNYGEHGYIVESSWDSEPAMALRFEVKDGSQLGAVVAQCVRMTEFSKIHMEVYGE